MASFERAASGYLPERCLSPISCASTLLCAAGATSSSCGLGSEPTPVGAKLARHCGADAAAHAQPRLLAVAHASSRFKCNARGYRHRHLPLTADSVFDAESRHPVGRASSVRLIVYGSSDVHSQFMGKISETVRAFGRAQQR
eukprot:6176049-Pleurochrysis_carterae.AAC.2